MDLSILYWKHQPVILSQRKHSASIYAIHYFWMRKHSYHYQAGVNDVSMPSCLICALIVKLKLCSIHSLWIWLCEPSRDISDYYQAGVNDVSVLACLICALNVNLKLCSILSIWIWLCEGSIDIYWEW